MFPGEQAAATVPTQGLKVNEVFQAERDRMMAKSVADSRQLSQLRYAEEKADLHLAEIGAARTESAIKYGVAGAVVGALLAFLLRR